MFDTCVQHVRYTGFTGVSLPKNIGRSYVSPSQSGSIGVSSTRNSELSTVVHKFSPPGPPASTGCPHTLWKTPSWLVDKRPFQPLEWSRRHRPAVAQALHTFNPVTAAPAPARPERHTALPGPRPEGDDFARPSEQHARRSHSAPGPRCRTLRARFDAHEQGRHLRHRRDPQGTGLLPPGPRDDLRRHPVAVLTRRARRRHHRRRGTGTHRSTRSDR